MNTIKYGSLQLPVINQVNDFVPKSAEPVILSSEDQRTVATGILHNFPILLLGEAGTGKTSIARYIAYIRKQGYSRISMTGYSTPDELIGSKSVKGGATYYEDGILTKAMKEGHIVVLDEINATPPDCLFILHGLLDEDRRITLPNGDMVRPHKDFRFIATMNPDYEGTKSLNRALLDRFSIIVSIDTLSPIKEKTLLVKRTGIEEDLAKKMVTTAWVIRKAYSEGKTLMYCSTRTLLQWAQLIKHGLDITKAYEITIENKSRAEERKSFHDFYCSVFKIPAERTAQDHYPVVLTKEEYKNLNDNLSVKTTEITQLEAKIRKLQTAMLADMLGSLEVGDIIEMTEEANLHYKTTKQGFQAKIVSLDKATGEAVVIAHGARSKNIVKNDGYETGYKFPIQLIENNEIIYKKI